MNYKNKIMNTKVCNNCGKDKPITEYSKRSKSKDGLQPKCKQCNKEFNDTYRKHNKEYWSFKTGYFSDKTKWKYIADYSRADKSIKVYKIEFDDGSLYIGSTKRPLTTRMISHVSDWWAYENGLVKKCIPGLYEQFNKLATKDAIKKHLKQNVSVLEETIGERTRQYKREQWWMDKYEAKGIKLLNHSRAYGVTPRTNTYIKKNK
tara:strand:+ start:1045 stop:1659 length:615 start_codon:yes stop_codon:yes gene_type:complete